MSKVTEVKTVEKEKKTTNYVCDGCGEASKHEGNLNTVMLGVVPSTSLGIQGFNVGQGNQMGNYTETSLSDRVYSDERYDYCNDCYETFVSDFKDIFEHEKYGP